MPTVGGHYFSQSEPDTTCNGFGVIIAFLNYCTLPVLWAVVWVDWEQLWQTWSRFCICLQKWHYRSLKCIGLALPKASHHSSAFSADSHATLDVQRFSNFRKQPI